MGRKQQKESCELIATPTDKRTVLSGVEVMGPCLRNEESTEVAVASSEKQDVTQNSPCLLGLSGNVQP